ncbi:MAG: DUF1565 domain-containing protein [Myxococcota bacterium]|nr:DUF1565 domain-containing protein [Myxococcota bacterium]
MSGTPLLLALLLSLGQLPAPREAWINPGSTVVPDGSRSAPYRTLTEALGALAPGCGLLRLGPGSHRAGVTLPPGCTLQGPSDAILEGGDGPFVLSAPAGVRLVGLTLREGEAGLSAAGESFAVGTRWLNSRGVAVRLAAGSSFRGGKNHFQTEVRTLRGVAAEASTLDLTDARFEGPFERGVELKGGSLTLRRAVFEGAATAVFQLGETVDLDDLSVQGGQEAAVVLVKVKGSVRRLRVRGHEYALLTRDTQQLVGEDLYSHGALRAAFGLVRSSARLRGLYALRPGPFGGLQLVQGEVEVRDFWIHQARDQAITTRDTRLVLLDGRVTDVTTSDDGGADAVQVRGGHATVQRVAVWRASGVGLLAAESGEVRARDVQLIGCVQAGAAAETRGLLSAQRLTVARSTGPALVAIEKGRLEIDGLRSVDNALGLVHAECGTGAQASLGRVVSSGNTALGEAGCVTRR